MNELISIVVPIYNVQYYLRKCIESLVNQTYDNIEIILVDDGSTDNSALICDEYCRDDNRIYVYHKSNGGLSDARNYGTSRANGSYIMYVDSDDYIEKDMVRYMYEKIQKYNADLCISGKYIVYETGEIKPFTEEGREELYDKKSGLIALNSYKGFDMSAWGKLYKRYILEGIEFPFGKKCEDYFTQYKIFSNCDKIIYDSKPFYYYIQRPGSISRSKLQDNSYIEASEQQAEFFKLNYPDISYVSESALVFAYISKINHCIDYGMKCDNNEAKYLKKEVRKRLKYVLSNKYLPVYKKVQALVFAVSIRLYCFLVIRIKHL